MGPVTDDESGDEAVNKSNMNPDKDQNMTPDKGSPPTEDDPSVEQ